MTQIKQFQNITVNFWINLSTLGNYDIVSSTDVLKISFPNDGNGFLFEASDSNETKFSVRSNETPQRFKWYMITLVYNQSELKGYIDSGIPATEIANGNALYNGNAGFQITGFNGRFSEFRVYDSALTSTEVQNLYDIGNNNGTLISSNKSL